MIHIWHDIWDWYEREQLDIFDTVGDENKRTDIGNRHDSLLVYLFLFSIASFEIVLYIWNDGCSCV